MVSITDRRKNGKKPILYGVCTGNKPDDSFIAAEPLFEYMAVCPVCEKRVLDISDPPDNHQTRIRLKCPHCRMIVKIPISEPR